MNSKTKKKKDLDRRRTEYLQNLPSFLSQLLLLLNSGMVLQDAFCQIAVSYEELPEKQKTLFTEEICRIRARGMRTGENVIRLFCDFGRSSGMKELSRTCGILAENLNRGTDLWERLSEESSQLWQERKRVALEQIRMGESKMSFPLGLLMMALLLVTAAPALMQL